MDTSSAEHYPVLYDACIAEAAAGGRWLMEKMIGETRMALQQNAAMSSGSLERDALAESLRLLNKHESLLCSLYPAALLTAFAEGGEAEKARPSAGPVLSFDQLELMDETQVQESVELARAQQAAQLATEGPLAEFNALICAAQGLKTVQPDRNPLRPEIYVRTLRTVLLQSEAPAAARLRWMQHLGAALGQQLGATYTSMSMKLRQGGVAAASYSVTQVAPGGGAARAKALIPDIAPPAAGKGSREEVILTVNQLRRLLAGELDADAAGAAGAGSPGAAGGKAKFAASGQGASRSDFNHTVPAAFEALQEMKQVDQVMKRLASRADQPAAAKGQAPGQPPAPAQPLSALREQLRTDARGVGQALGLEVVNLMVENIASDARLLPPVQQAVRELEPALLRLALIDPRFFSDKQHPARRLLEQMTQRSLAWKDASAPAFKAFMDPLSQVVQVLSSVPVENAEPFDYALKSLLDTWSEQQRSERRQRETAVQSLLHAEQRNILAEKIGKDIRAREDTAYASSDMLAFLTGPWTQVMAQARISDRTGTPDPGGYSAAINDLLWSAQPDLARNSVARLTRLIPSLLGTLREGLASIQYPPEKTQAFFEDLMSLHQQALRPAGALPPQVPATREELAARFEASDNSEPWIAPAEAVDSGFMDTNTLDPSAGQPASARPGFADTQPGFKDTAPYSSSFRPVRAPEPVEDIIPAGSWVEFLVGHRATRTQLTWASPHGTLFMFTNAEGGTHSMTRRSLDKLLADGSLRVISDNAVVDEALDAVAQTAMRNSLDISL